MTAPLHRAGMFLGRKIPGGFSWAPHRLRGLLAESFDYFAPFVSAHKSIYIATRSTRPKVRELWRSRFLFVRVRAGSRAGMFLGEKVPGRGALSFGGDPTAISIICGFFAAAKGGAGGRSPTQPLWHHL